MKIIVKKEKEKVYKNFFGMSEAELAVSKLLFGRIIKCIVAPNFTHLTFPIDNVFSSELLEDGDLSLYIYPEKDMTIPQRRTFIETSLQKEGDIYIVTSDLQIILDLPKECIRVMNEYGTLIEPYEQTFVANPHTVLFKILNVSDTNNFGTKVLNKIITELNDKKVMKAERFKECQAIHAIIGEPIIKHAMENNFAKVKVENGLNDPRQIEIRALENQLARLNEIKAQREREEAENQKGKGKKKISKKK